MMTRRTCLALAAAVPRAAGARTLPLALCCARDNDLYRVLEASGIHGERFDSAADAIGRAQPGWGVALLADGYPDRTTAVEPGLLAAAARKKVRILIEYAGWLPGLTMGAPRDAERERAVVASDVFGPALERLRILAAHRCRFVPMDAGRMDLALARVAGFDTAVYGLPKSGVYPLLFEHPAGGMLVAATKLSQFVTARYAPPSAWGAVWKRILEWLCPASGPLVLRWTPAVAASFTRAGRAAAWRRAAGVPAGARVAIGRPSRTRNMARGRRRWAAERRTRY